MNSPQQQAEEMARKCAVDMINIENQAAKMGINFTHQRIILKVESSIAKNIPLVELLAVAKAAKARRNADSAIDAVEADIGLGIALSALEKKGVKL
jgi:ABC-type sugar transport system ATPase subunit